MAAVYSILGGFGEQDTELTEGDPEPRERGAELSTRIRFGPATSFAKVGRQLAKRFTLNRKQGIALRLICRQLDRIRRDERGTTQLCLFVGSEGSTGKSRVIEAVAELFSSKDVSHRMLVTAISGTAAARINGVTIHSACGFRKTSHGEGLTRRPTVSRA